MRAEESALNASIRAFRRACLEGAPGLDAAAEADRLLQQAATMPELEQAFEQARETWLLATSYQGIRNCEVGPIADLHVEQAKFTAPAFLRRFLDACLVRRLERELAEGAAGAREPLLRLDPLNETAGAFPEPSGEAPGTPRLRHRRLDAPAPVRPMDICFLDGRIYALDGQGPHVARLDPDGAGRVADAGLQDATCIFPDPEGTLWVCERGPARITCLDAELKTLWRRSVAELLGQPGPLLPVFGTSHKGFLYLSAQEEIAGFRRYALFRLSPDGSLPARRLAPNLEEFQQVAEVGGELLLGDVISSRIFRLSPGGEILEALALETDEPFIRFHGGPSGLFLSTYYSLNAFDRRGKRLWRLRRRPGLSAFGGIVEHHAADARRIFVAGPSDGCVHALEWPPDTPADAETESPAPNPTLRRYLK